MVKIDISRIVRRHRERANLSRVELALLAGVGKTVVYDIEHGKLSVRFDTLSKILEALNISIKYDSPIMGEFDR